MRLRNVCWFGADRGDGVRSSSSVGSVLRGDGRTRDPPGRRRGGLARSQGAFRSRARGDVGGPRALSWCGPGDRRHLSGIDHLPWFDACRGDGQRRSTLRLDLGATGEPRDPGQKRAVHGLSERCWHHKPLPIWPATRAAHPVVMTGIADALVATPGPPAAIPAVIAFNYFREDLRSGRVDATANWGPRCRTPFLARGPHLPASPRSRSTAARLRTDYGLSPTSGRRRRRRIALIAGINARRCRHHAGAAHHLHSRRRDRERRDQGRATKSASGTDRPDDLALTLDEVEPVTYVEKTRPGLHLCPDTCPTSRSPGDHAADGRPHGDVVSPRPFKGRGAPFAINFDPAVRTGTKLRSLAFGPRPRDSAAALAIALRFTRRRYGAVRVTATAPKERVRSNRSRENRRHRSPASPPASRPPTGQRGDPASAATKRVARLSPLAPPHRPTSYLPRLFARAPGFV